MKKNANLKKMERMAAATYNNAVRLHKDSILLFKNDSFPSSYNLSVHCLEEIGKFFWIDDFIYHSNCNVNGRWEPDYEEKFLKSIFLHKAKQNMFSYANNPPDNAQEIVKQLESGKIEKQKQDSMYVGLPREKGKFNLYGRIIIPSKKITEKVAFKQLTFMNDYIVCAIAGLKKGAYCVDIKEVEDLLDYPLMKELQKLWPSMSKRAQKRFDYLMSHPDID